MIKKGDTYCTMWTTRLVGHFTYDGQSNISNHGIIEGDKDSLLLVKKGFDIMYQHNIDGEFDFVKRVIGFLSEDSINECIDNIPDKVLELEELKKYSTRIKKVIGG